ncbi:MAG: glycosyltransferase family 4 protein [Bacteroidetes bacterium]|nr:glycosyltransferase family 4 protein [Bacteroidota bacterium]
MRFADLNYYANNDLTDIRTAVSRFGTSYGYLSIMRSNADVQVVLHLNSETATEISGVPYSGFRSRNKFFHIPFGTHRYIKSKKPDVVLVQGIVFPVQVLALRLALGKKVKIIAQHHGEPPFINTIKRRLQKLADKYIDAYLFTAKGNAQKWVDAGVINNVDKCYEVLEASTDMKRLNKNTCCKQLGISGDLNFLSVGRLIPGKDPLTILSAFEQFALANPVACLYMIYQDDTMLDEVKGKIEQSTILKNTVHLVGKVNHGELAAWFTACNFFVSGSHHEAAGFALIECMACGCIPVVTDIPSFLSITDDGKLAYTFKPGDVNGLLQAMQKAALADRDMMTADILSYFEQHLSYKAIADSIYDVCRKLMQ